MRRHGWILGTVGSLSLILSLASDFEARQLQKKPQVQPDGGFAKPEVATAPVYRKAFVIDERLSALRREPGLQSQVIRRLRLGHAVYIVGAGSGHSGFYRVAVTRRTRGWVHPSALAVQGRAGEDQRIMNLIENSKDGLDRISLCKMLIERFAQSRLVPRALLQLGEEADRAAETLTQRTRKRLAEVRSGNTIRLKDYYLSDAGLDRYSKLRIVFDFNESIAEFVYDGRAYRDILRRFSDRAEATLARERLELAGKKMAQR